MKRKVFFVLFALVLLLPTSVGAAGMALVSPLDTTLTVDFWDYVFLEDDDPAVVQYVLHTEINGVNQIAVIMNPGTSCNAGTCTYSITGQETANYRWWVESIDVGFGTVNQTGWGEFTVDLGDIGGIENPAETGEAPDLTNLQCPAETPSSWGTATPNALWNSTCGHCFGEPLFPTPEGTATPYGYPTATAIPPTPTSAPPATFVGVFSDGCYTGCGSQYGTAAVLDDDPNTFWSSDTDAGPNWLMFEYATNTEVVSVDIMHYNESFTHIQIQGTANDVDYDILYDNSSLGAWVTGQYQTLNLTTTGNYYKYFVHFIEPDGWSTVAEMRMTQASELTPTPTPTGNEQMWMQGVGSCNASGLGGAGEYVDCPTAVTGGSDVMAVVYDNQYFQTGDEYSLLGLGGITGSHGAASGYNSQGFIADYVVLVMDTSVFQGGNDKTSVSDFVENYFSKTPSWREEVDYLFDGMTQVNATVQAWGSYAVAYDAYLVRYSEPIVGGGTATPVPTPSGPGYCSVIDDTEYDGLFSYSGIVEIGAPICFTLGTEATFMGVEIDVNDLIPIIELPDLFEVCFQGISTGDFVIFGLPIDTDGLLLVAAIVMFVRWFTRR